MRDGQRAAGAGPPRGGPPDGKFYTPKSHVLAEKFKHIRFQAPFALSSTANSDAASIEELFSAEPVAPRLLNGAGGAAGSGRDNRDAIQHIF